MFQTDPDKNYSIQILIPGRDILSDALVSGSDLDAKIQQYRIDYPDFKKIVVYDAFTKEALGIIKP